MLVVNIASSPEQSQLLIFPVTSLLQPVALFTPAGNLVVGPLQPTPCVVAVHDSERTVIGPHAVVYNYSLSPVLR